MHPRGLIGQIRTEHCKRESVQGIDFRDWNETSRSMAGSGPRIRGQTASPSDLATAGSGGRSESVFPAEPVATQGYPR